MPKLVSIALATALILQPTRAMACDGCRFGESATDVLAQTISQAGDLELTSLDRWHGALIVVRRVSDNEVSGRLRLTSADGLVVELKGGAYAVSKNQICQIVVRKRERSKVISWIAVPALAGLVFGIV